MPKKHDPKPCAVETCEAIALARGWCNRHYTQWQRTGDPRTQREQSAGLRIASLTIVPNLPRAPALGSRVAEIEAAAAASPDLLAPWNAAALGHARRLAASLDWADENPDVEFDQAKINPQYLAAMVQCGLTPGARKPAKKAEADGPVFAAVADF